MTEELERFQPAAQHGRIAYEHLHRYAICCEHVAGRRVLDMACGTGYGTALLARAASLAVGLDISPAAIRDARQRYTTNGVRYQVGDCYDLPFEPGSFDVVVANEMIEHVDDHDALMAEVRRVLVPGGLFLVSTPNKPVYNRYKTPNPYHTSEMDLPEFHRLLCRHFTAVRMTGSRMALVSVGFSLEAAVGASNLGAARIYRGSIGTDSSPHVDVGELTLTDPEYLLACCSDAEIDLPPTQSSLFYASNEDLWLEHEKILAWASQLHDEDEQLRGNLRTAEARAEAEQAVAAAASGENVRMAERLAELQSATSVISDVVERERQTLAHERRRDTDMTSRLLRQMTGDDVPAEPVAIVESLFKLNGQLLTERHARARAEEIMAQMETSLVQQRTELTNALAARAETEVARQQLVRQIEHQAETLTGSRNECDALTVKLSQLERLATNEAEARRSAESEVVLQAANLQSLMTEHAALASAKASLEAEAKASTAALAARETSLAQAQVDLKAATDDQDLARAERIAMAAEIERRTAELASLQAQAQAMRQEAEIIRAASRAEQTDSSPASAVALPGQVAAETALAARTAALDEATSAVAVPMTKATAALEVATGKRQSDARDGRKEQLVALHRRVRQELVAASISVRKRVPEDPPRPTRTLLNRLLDRPVPLITGLFDPAWITRQVPDAVSITLARYLSDRFFRAIDPHPLFSASAYLERHPDVAQSGMPALAHYVEHGWREGRDPHRLFPNDWYLARNPDVLDAGDGNPIDHYLSFGWREGRWPNPLFDPRAYLDRYADVDANGMEPLTHFVTHGQFENREAQFKGRDPDWQPMLGGKLHKGGLMDMLLHEEPPTRLAAASTAVPAKTDHEVSGAMPVSWPPPPLGDYWPTQTMRDFILDGYGEDVLNVFWHLFSVMEVYSSNQNHFAESSVCDVLVARAQATSNQLAESLPSTPDASVIIPVYNNIVDTMLCVVSVLEHETERSFEIIVADDGSSDATSRLIASLGGIVRFVRQSKNLGFLGNCNAAALQAAGNHMVLLNNDTLVCPGWLDGLITPFALDEKVGLVGSKLINWDGTLQEAGGIFWRDGSAWNFGRGKDARAPEFSYLKDVDYCSGASIAVAAHVWRALKGFDPMYSPAYCEDSDLAFRVRDAGYRTLFNPTSEVVHHEGRSHGRDVASGIKAYQVTNQQRLRERWRSVLERDHFPNGQNVLRARDRSFNKRHVLVIDHYVPQWDRDAGSRTVYQYIKLLIDIGCAVTFWPDNLWRDAKYTPILQSLGVEVIFGSHYVNGFPKFIQERADLYNMVFISRPHVAVKYIAEIRNNSTARIVFYGMDLHFLRMQAAAAVGQAFPESEIEAMRALELEVCRGSDVIFYPDPTEVAIVRAAVGGDREFLANPVFVYGEKQIAEGRARLPQIAAPALGRLLFVGGFAHTPNHEGIIWFAEQVFPLVQQQWPTVSLTIVGSNPPEDVCILGDGAIQVLGFVSDAELDECYNKTDLVIAPLRFGAGVKGKVIEAMMKAVPVATTSFGAQGIDLPELTMFLGETETQLAEAIIHALSDRSEAQQRSTAALEFIKTSYSESVMRDIFIRFTAS